MLGAPRNRRNATERGTMQQTISQAAQLYGKARSTIHRAIASGRLSCGVRGDGVRVIQLAELIRLWGEPPNAPPQAQQNATPDEPPAQQALVAELRALREEVAALREEVHQLRRLPAPSPADTPAPANANATPSPSPRAAEEGAQGADDPAPEPVTPGGQRHPPRDFSDLLSRFESRTTKH